MYAFPKSVRIRHKLDFRRTMDQGRKTVCSKMVLIGRLREPTDVIPTKPGLRMGLVVSRKVGDSVRRNRVKRHLRESFRVLRAELEAQGPVPNLDLVVIARNGAAEMDGAALQADLVQCLQRFRRQANAADRSANTVAPKVRPDGPA
jgi:ribonuclease P protein component